MNPTQRARLQGSLGGFVLAQCPSHADEGDSKGDLKGKVGITTGSFMPHLAVNPAAGKLRLLGLPLFLPPRAEPSL